MADIFSQLASRSSAPGFGYGLGTAENHVKRFLGNVGSEVAGGRDTADSLVKRAASVATWMGQEDSYKQFTNASDFAGVMPDGVDLPPHTLMVIRNCLTTDREDRDGDILRTEGAELDPKAPLLWQHMHNMPMGGVLAKVEHTDRKLTIVTAMLDLGPLTADAAKLVEANMLRFSHGFRIFEYEERKEPSKMGFPGFDIKRFEIMEASLVSVPSNVDAEIEMIASAKFASDEFKAMQKHVQSQRPTQVAGATLESTEESLPLFKDVNINVIVKGAEAEVVEEPVEDQTPADEEAKAADDSACDTSPCEPSEPDAEEATPEKSDSPEVTETADSGNDDFGTRLFAAVDRLVDGEEDEQRFLEFIEKFADAGEPLDEIEPDVKSIAVGYILSSTKGELQFLKGLVESQSDLRDSDELAAEFADLL